MFAAMNLIPFDVVVDSCSSGRSSTSIVGGRSSIAVVGSPAEKLVSPFGARQSAVCRSAGVKDWCSSVPASRASRTFWAHCIEFLLAAGFRWAAAIILLVLPPIVVSRTMKVAEERMSAVF